MPDPAEGAFTDYGFNWPVPTVDTVAARMREPGWGLANTYYSGGVTVDSASMVPAPQRGTLNLTVQASSAATAAAGSTFTVITNGSNVTFPNGWGSPSVAMTGYGPPPPEPLAVRRFYHWNKSATAGAAAYPGSAQKDDAGGTRPIVGVMAAAAPSPASARARSSSRSSR
jgi:hypothetical protein